MTPKITIILTLKNSTEFLDKCLSSIICQTYENLEIICINSSRAKSVKETLLKYKEKDKRIEILTCANKNIPAQINLKINEAKGEYISFINPRDWLLLDLYERFISFITEYKEKPDVYMFNAALYSEKINDVMPTTFFNINNWEKQSQSPFYTFDNANKPFSENLSLVNKIFRKDFLINNDIKYTNLYFQEQYLCIKSFLKAGKILLNDEISYKQRISDEKILNKTNETKIFDIFKIVDLIEKEINKTPLKEDLKYAFFQYKYITYSQFYALCAQNLKKDFLNETQKRLASKNFTNLNFNICRRLRNYDIYERLLKL